MSDIVIELEEESARSIPKAEFDESIAQALDKDFYLEVDPPSWKNDHCYVLRSRGYIGQIPVSEDTVIRIRPKVPIHNLFRMLEYAYNLKSFQFLEGKTAVDSLDDLFENLASILAKRVLDRARKGLYCSYVEEEDSLPYLRGRIKVVPSIIRASMRGTLRFECEYEEHTANVEDNHILVWALLQLPRFPLKRNEVRQQVRQAYRALASTVDVKHVEPCACINRFYHRLNDDYRPMHGLCRFFLEQTGPSVEVGEHEFIPFVLNMPNLFESFVAIWLQIHLPEDLRIETQYNAELGQSGIVFRIDLVLIDAASNAVIAVLDTKYKRKEAPENADIHQIVAYAVRMHTQNAFLIYPSLETRSKNLPLGGVTVRSLVFNIGIDPDEAGKLFLEELLELLKL